MALLNRDNIKLEEVCDYHIYPIADNDTPMLSADRLEYTFSNGLGVRKYLWTLDEVREVYNNLVVLKNENGIDEIGFTSVKCAEMFVERMSVLSSSYIDSKTKLAMQIFADIMKRMSNDGVITLKDMYSKSEKEVIDLIKNYDKYNVRNVFNHWENLDDVCESDECVPNTYCVSIKAKLRYITPLVKIENKTKRVQNVSNKAKEAIDRAVNFTTKKYAYINTNFTDN